MKFPVVVAALAGGVCLGVFTGVVIPGAVLVLGKGSVKKTLHSVNDFETKLYSRRNKLNIL